MQPNQISQVIESSLGFHVLLCEAVLPAGKAPLSQVRESVRGLLEARRKKICQ